MTRTKAVTNAKVALLKLERKLSLWHRNALKADADKVCSCAAVPVIPKCTGIPTMSTMILAVAWFVIGRVLHIQQLPRGLWQACDSCLSAQHVSIFLPVFVLVWIGCTSQK